METTRKRGRPRAFEPDEVLPRAFETFLRHGYAGTSTDALAGAMGLSKPSLYAAFGDKRQLFQRVLDERIGTLTRRFKLALDRGTSLETKLEALFLEAVTVYEEQPGCVVISAAVTEAPGDEALAAFTREFFERTDRALAAVLGGPTVGRLANAVIHDIALRSRIGESKTKLETFARASAAALARVGEMKLSPPGTPRKGARRRRA